jgi:hypothetical protein
MSDITEIFSKVAPNPADPTSDQLDADIARGHRALRQADRQRRIKRSMITATGVAAAAVLVVVGAQLHGNGSAKAPAHTVAKNPSAIKVVTPTKAPVKVKVKVHHQSTAIKLVAYHGTQLHGFTVDSVPQGWFLSTSTADALLIDPDGSTDHDSSVFVGKLAVLTSSVDQHGLGKGTSVTVNGKKGVISDQGKYGLMLSYNTDRFGIDIQAPAQLHWTNNQLVAFAEGVHETSDAVQGEG